jgi:hypothetical protein
MKERPSLVLFDAKATSGTNSYPSGFSCPGRNGNWFGTIHKTGTGTGSIAFQTNALEEDDFKADPTAGWDQLDFAAGTGVTSGKLDIAATNPSSITFKIRGLAARRVRVVVTNATGTMTISGWLHGN